MNIYVRSKPLFAATTALMIGLMAVMLCQPPARAEEKGMLEKLLRGSEGMSPGTKALDGQSSKSDETVRRVPYSQGEIQLSFAPLVREVADSVVNVYATRRIERRLSPFAGDPFFERFFGTRRPRQRKQIESSLGSGVIVRENGLIITNHHVIKDAQDVKIALHDGREFACDIVLKDEKSDLAVLKVRDKVKLKPIKIGDSDSLAVGDLVLAIGNPFGVGQTVTSGIVSAIARTRHGITDFGFFIQTDAAINPGNSGGALVDMRGQLVGINTAIFSRSGGSNGIGFAIPSDMAKVIIRSAEQGDRVLRPWIGADFQEVTSDIAESLGMKRPEGALLASVYPDGPADKAGLSTGDVIVAINDNRIDHIDALGYRLATAGIGATVDVTLFSKGKNKSVQLTLKGPPETVPRNEIEMPDGSPLEGATIINLSPAVAEEINMPTNLTGVVIAKLQRGSYAASNGLRPGDIIIAANGTEVTDSTQVFELLAEPSQRWTIEIMRHGRHIVLQRNGNLLRQFRN